MPSSYTSSLGLVLPVQGELSGTWGDTVNNYLTTYVDSAVAGQLAISLTGNLSLSKTTGTSLGSTSSQYAILNVTPSASTWTITVPAASQIYHINNLSSTHTFTIKATGQTGFVVAAAEKCVVAYNGTDFVRVGSTSVFGSPSTAMTLNASGNLLVGNTTETSTATPVKLSTGGTYGTSLQTGMKVMAFESGATNHGMGIVSGLLYLNTGDNANIGFGIANVEKMRLNASGNLGVGVTPSAWSQGQAIELQNPGYGIWNGSGAPASMYMLANAYYNSGFKYGGTGQASHYYQYLGQHIWSVAPANPGAAGTAITFTQAMTLDNSGNLGIGTTTITAPLSFADTVGTAGSINRISLYQASGVSNYGFGISSAQLNYMSGDNHVFFKKSGGTSTEYMRLDASGRLLVGTTSNAGIVIGNSVNPGFVVESGGTFYNQVNTGSILYMYNASGYSSGTFQTFYTEGTERGSISYNGSVIVYATSSDYRLKTLSSRILASDAGARIDSLNPIEYIWKENNRPERGFFAHEFQSVYPNSVNGEKDAIDSVGNPLYQSMQASSSEVIADLIAEIQSLRIRISQLEAK
jgi:hypothetical protein